MQTRLRRNSNLLPFLTAAMLLMELFDGSRIWALLLVGLGGAWLVSYLWARSLQRNLRFTREMRFGWAQVGDTLEERLTLDNRGWAPALWVEIKDRSTLPGYRASEVTGVGSGSRNQWRTRGLCTRRGLYTIGPTQLETGDPLGVYTLLCDDPSSTHLMVMPPVVTLPSIEVAPGGLSGDGRPRQNAPERTVSAASVRAYAPGDSLHTIHWPTTARHDAPYVHIFDGTPAGDWWIILDLDQRAQVGQDWDSTEEHAIILAASLADRGLRQRRAVGLAANAEKLVWLPPQEGDHHRWEILRALALVKPGPVPLAALLERTRPLIGRQCSVIVITPNLSGAWLEYLLPLLWRGIVPTILLLDAATFAAPGVGSADVDPRLAGAPKEDKRPTGEAQALAETLAQLGLARYIITHDMLNQPEMRPGQRGKWEWRATPTGRAEPVHQPGDTAWKMLSG